MNSFWYKFKIVLFTPFSIFFFLIPHYMSLAIIFTEGKHRRDSVQPALYLSTWIITKFRGVCLVLYLIMRCYKMFLHFLSSTYLKALDHCHYETNLSPRKDLWDVHSWHPVQNRAENRIYVLSPQATLPSSLQQLSDMCSLFSPVPAVPRSRIRELSFRSKQLCLWGPLSWSLVLQLVPPQQASSDSETKRSPCKLQPLSL